MDVISRSEVIDRLYDWSDHSASQAETWHLRQVIGDIKSMPGVKRISGKWNVDQRNDWHVTQIDNRDAERIDITDEYYHEKYDTISCPHCGCTLSAFVVMPFHYCYMCGGQFGNRKLTVDRR